MKMQKRKKIIELIEDGEVSHADSLISVMPDGRIKESLRKRLIVCMIEHESGGIMDMINKLKDPVARQFFILKYSRHTKKGIEVYDYDLDDCYAIISQLEKGQAKDSLLKWLCLELIKEKTPVRAAELVEEISDEAILLQICPIFLCNAIIESWGHSAKKVARLISQEKRKDVREKVKTLLNRHYTQKYSSKTLTLRVKRSNVERDLRWFDRLYST